MIHERIGCWLLAVAVSCLWIGGCRQTTRTRELPQFESRFTVTPADLRIPMVRLPLFNYPLIDAKIGASEVRLLVDTGAGHLMIINAEFLPAVRRGTEAETAARLGLIVDDSGFGEVESLVLGDGYVAEHVPLLLHGYTELLKLTRSFSSDTPALGRVEGQFSELQRISGTRFDGVLGLAALADVVLDLDPSSGSMHLRSRDAPYRADGAIELKRPAGYENDRRPFAVLNLNGHSFPALLDTCAHGISIPKHIFDVTGATLDDPVPVLADAGFETPELPSIRGTLERLDLGLIRLDRPQVVVLPHRGPDQDQAIVGQAVLRHFRMIYDVRSRSLRLVGPKVIDRPSPDPRLLEALDSR